MPETRTALIVGASRTLGLGMAEGFIRHGWNVVGTVRGTERTELHDVADRSAGRLQIESVDMNDDEDVRALRRRLAGQRFDLVFVNAAVADPDRPIGEVDRQTFVDVMVTNAYSPMRLLEQFEDLVPETGGVGVMSSGQGSISMNTSGGHEVYRASKSALNQLMRSYAARHQGDPRSMFLIHPGWVQTDLGGPGAVLTVDQSAPAVVATLLKHLGEPGLMFLDHQDRTVPW